MAKNKLNPKVLARTFAVAALFVDVTGYIWHGLLQQPSIMKCSDITHI